MFKYLKALISYKMALEKLILWKPLYKTTIVLYVLVFLLMIPAPQIATLLLFAIVAMWSRIPALMTIFTKDVECVDFLTVIIAIHMGGLTGAIFGSSIILFTRIFGPTEDLDYTIKESVCFFAGAFVSLGVFKLTGNVTITMFSFTFIRYTLYPCLTLVTQPGKVFMDLVILSVSAPIAVFSNLLLLRLTGPALDRIFAKGAIVSWELLLFVTAIIGGFFLVSKFMAREEEKRIAKEGETAAELPGVPEPHEALFSMLTIGPVSSFFRVTPNLFKGFAVTILFVLILIRSFQSAEGINLLSGIILFFGVCIAVEALHWSLDKYLVKHPRQSFV